MPQLIYSPYAKFEEMLLDRACASTKESILQIAFGYLLQCTLSYLHRLYLKSLVQILRKVSE
jgi:hypothetical protein